MTCYCCYACLQFQELGVADLSIEFPNSGPYPGHFKEKGYNALFINNAANCFARNLRIINAGKGAEVCGKPQPLMVLAGMFVLSQHQHTEALLMFRSLKARSTASGAYYPVHMGVTTLRKGCVWYIYT
jgi:hypothetical protein